MVKIEKDLAVPSEPDYLTILNRVSEKKLQHGFEALNAVERVLFCIDWISFELTQGDLATYYHNSAGAFAVETVSALEAIGAHELAAILRQANALFPHRTPSREQAERWEIVQPLLQPPYVLTTLTTQFRDHWDDLNGFEDYIRNHMTELGSM